jgi:chromosome segregation ATPase
MADEVPFTDDISGLWGAPEEGALEPPRLTGAVTNGHALEPPPTNGRHAEVVADDPREKVARLAEALASHQVDVVRHSDLVAVRAEMEDAFTQKLAVALYELLSASNERFASVEDQMGRRLREVAEQVGESITVQGDRLVLAIDAQQRATADLARSVSDELREVSDRFNAPLDTLADFQREMRHEVGRVGDSMEAHGVDAAQRAELDIERAAKAGAEMSERLEASDTRAAESAATLSERIASVQSDLTEVHEALRALREEVKSLRGRSGTRRRWGRPG